jgi:hypothetical protein
VGHDINPAYLVGGVYKRRIIEKLGKGRSEKTKLGRTYIAYPPPGGWPGGLPEQNGYRAGSRK